VRERRRDVVLGSVLVTIHQVAEVLVPVTIGVVIDRAIAPGDGEQALRWLVVLTAQFAILSASGCYGLFVFERVKLDATHGARVDVADRVLDPRGGLESSLTGEIVSLSTVETNRIGEGVSSVIMAIGAVTGVLAGALILLRISWWLGLTVIIGLPIVLVVVQMLAQPLIDKADEQQEAVGVASGVASDLLRGLRVVKGLGADAAASDRYRSASRRALDAGLAANRARSSYAGFTVTIASAFVILVAGLGGRLALDGTISLGELVAALGVTQFMVGPLGRLAYASSQWAQAKASAEHVDALLATPPAVTVGTARLSGRPSGELTVSGLTHKSLRDVSFSIAPGELVGVVAEPNDAAALIECLDRSADPGAGQVLVGGVVHHELVLDDARAAVVVGHHDAPIFGGTIGDNVAVASGSSAAGTERWPTIVTASSLDDVLDATGGLEGVISEEGRSLSGGQRQRVALARALATDAPVLVLHEPTTAVDTATEHRITHGLRAARAGADADRPSTVVVTTSPTILAAADRVVVIRDGRVVATGRHEDLAAADERYREVVLR
jgi:putative ABC transport system ATP-binding protein